jgi:uroporphyrinogen decarboxylase
MYRGKERILKAFSHEKADRLPVFDVVNKPDMYENLLGQSNFNSDGRLCVQLAKKLGMDAVTVHSAPYTCLIPPKEKWDSSNTFTDRFGLRFKVEDTSWPLGMIREHREADEDFLQTLKSAEITDEDIAQVKAAVEEANDEIAVFGSVRGTFGFLFIALGLENLTYAMYDDPELLQEIIEAADDFWTQLGLKLIEAGCTALYVANDMGMNGSTLISPAQLREFFFPSLRKQIAAWKAAGGKVLFHSCGNVDAVLEDLADMGIDALNNIQVHSGMNLASVKERIGDRVTVVGNIDATGIMCGTDQTLISDAIRQVIDTAGYDGGLIIATDHSFHEGIPQENVLYFLEKAKELGWFE